KDIAEHREGAVAGGNGALVRNEAVSAAGIAVVPGIIAAQTEEDIGRRLNLDRSAGRPDGLVVVGQAISQVLAEACVAKTRDGRANPQARGERLGAADDRVELSMRSDIGARAEVWAVGRDSSRHIFDCAANGIAAVERTLRSAQHLDPLDVVDIEQRRLGTVEVDVVEIQTDALLES